jgi:AraC family transcriptional regulator
VRYCVLRIAPAYLERLADSSLLGIAPRQAHRDEFLFRAIERLASLCSAEGDVADMFARSLTDAIGWQVATAAAAIAPHPVPAMAPRAESALREFIQARLGAPLSLDEMADVAGMSPHALLRAFKARFGATPMQYVIGRRLAEAQRLLETSADTVADIAAATGFCSHSHLTDAFRRRYGITPSRYRSSA